MNLASPPARARTLALVLLLTASLLFAGLLARVIQLQVAPGAQLTEHIDARASSTNRNPVRGDIRDRRGRIVAATRFGYRAFIDPVVFDNGHAGLNIVRLAQAIDQPPEDVAARLVRATQHNQQQLTKSTNPDTPPRLRRYVSVGDVLPSWRADAVAQLDIPGVHLEQRPVRETLTEETLRPIVGLVGIDHNGLIGAEHMLDRVLTGEPGSLRYVRDRSRRPMWIHPGNSVAPQRGRDVRLSIDLHIQRTAASILEQTLQRTDAQGARCVVLEPNTGEILAMLDITRRIDNLAEIDWDQAVRDRRVARGPRYRILEHTDGPVVPNRCIEHVYEPGSTFKPFVWAAITETGLLEPHTIINTENGRWRTPFGRTIPDVKEFHELPWDQVLVRSSNIGMAKGAMLLSHEQLHAIVRDFGFGSSTNLGLGGESPGIVTPQSAWTDYTQTSVAIGHEIGVTPIQMARAFAAFARTGSLAGTIPQPTILERSQIPDQSPARRVLNPQTVQTIRPVLAQIADNVEQRMLRTGAIQTPFRYSAFGKSGTAKIPIGAPPEGVKLPRGFDGYLHQQYNASFIIAGPTESPRALVLVLIEDPSPDAIRRGEHWGSTAAGPAARRILEQTLLYLGAPQQTPGDTVAAR